jgi:hypothetical protein
VGQVLLLEVPGRTMMGLPPLGCVTISGGRGGAEPKMLVKLLGPSLKYLTRRSSATAATTIAKMTASPTSGSSHRRVRLGGSGGYLGFQAIAGRVMQVGHKSSSRAPLRIRLVCGIERLIPDPYL